MIPPQWQIVEKFTIPDWFQESVQAYTLGREGKFAAQLLWQRGIRTKEELKAFIDPEKYIQHSPLVFGQEMEQAVARLVQARQKEERVAIWGDFDADGVTATSVLWEGLREFFEQETQLSYYIPNRLHESHGLNNQGLEKLAVKGIKLIVTCDTGSTNLAEIIYAQALGMDVIVTDHHTLPEERPPVVAIINPRYLPSDHPLFNLSGVAVAYKLVEALYEVLPEVPQQDLRELLDLVAIGLIADLVNLKGESRLVRSWTQKLLSP